MGIPSPEIRVGEYPHQLSGGMRQRIMIAMALAANPSLLLADEPTTALDVTVQAQILELMHSLQRELGMAIVLITHDLGVIAQVCDDVVVMYAGQVAEQGTVEAIFRRPMHPYTRGLLASVPRLTTLRKSRLPTIEGTVPGLNEMPTGCRYQNRCPYARRPAAAPARPAAGADRRHPCRQLHPLARAAVIRAVRKGKAMSEAVPLLQVEGLKTHFPVKGGVWMRSVATCKAVDGVSFKLMPGETLGLVGESGCGKTTLGKSIVRLVKPTEGPDPLRGDGPREALSRGRMKPVRRHLQMIFQDPAESLNARHTVGQILEEPFIIHRPRLCREVAAGLGREAGRPGGPAQAGRRPLPV